MILMFSPTGPSRSRTLSMSEAMDEWTSQVNLKKSAIGMMRVHTFAGEGKSNHVNAVCKTEVDDIILVLLGDCR